VTLYATYIRTAIDELLAGTIGSVRTVTADTLLNGHDDAWEGLSISKARYDLTLGAIEQHPSSPISALTSYRIGRLPVTIALRFHLPTAATESERDDVRASAYELADTVIQALGYPGNLTQTDDENATGIISGMLTNLGTNIPVEDWEAQILTIEVTGDAIVQIVQVSETASPPLDNTMNLIEFANASGRYLVDPNSGDVDVFAANVGAYTTIDGRKYLQVEQSRQCLVTNNQELDHADWTKTTSADDLYAVTDPVGGSTAYAYTPSTDNAIHSIKQTKTCKTLALFAKANGYGYAYIRYTVGANVASVICNLSDGTLTEVVETGVTQVSFSRSLALSWGGYYFEITLSASTTVAEYGVSNSDSTITFSGNGIDRVAIWCPQANVSDMYCSSPIATTSSAVTRAPDEAYIPAADVTTSLKNRCEVRWIPHGSSDQITDSHTIFEFEDSDYANVICYYDGNDKKIKVAGSRKQLLAGTAAHEVKIDSGRNYLYISKLNGQKVGRIDLSDLSYVDIISASDKVSALDIDDNYIYYCIYAGADRGLWRANIDGSGSTQLYADALTPYLGSLNSDGTKFYWVTTGAYMRSYRISDGYVTTNEVIQAGMLGVALDATNLYYTASNLIKYRPEAGGAASTLVTAGNIVRGISVDDNYIYFQTDDAYAYMAPKDTGSPIVTLAESLIYSSGITNADNMVYFNSTADTFSIQNTRLNSDATTHNALDTIQIALKRALGSMTIYGLSTGNGTYSGTIWALTDGNMYVGMSRDLDQQADGLVSVNEW